MWVGIWGIWSEARLSYMEHYPKPRGLEMSLSGESACWASVTLQFTNWDWGWPEYEFKIPNQWSFQQTILSLCSFTMMYTWMFPALLLCVCCVWCVCVRTYVHSVRMHSTCTAPEPVHGFWDLTVGHQAHEQVHVPYQAISYPCFQL